MSSPLSNSCLKTLMSSHYVLNLCKLLVLIYKILQESPPTNLSDLPCHSLTPLPLDPNYSALFLVLQTLKLFHTF